VVPLALGTQSNGDMPGPEPLATGGEMPGSLLGPTVDTVAHLEPHFAVLEGFLDKLAKMDSDGFFREPVRAEDAPKYHEVIDRPMDFRTMREKVQALS
jgi:Bromodomain